MQNENEAELRLALVCYGGASLAVYMHGVTKELHKLIRASRKFDERPAENPFRSGSEKVGTEAVYFDALQELAAAGRRLDVNIDIIAGTSAGGINGVALSKALARDAELESLTKIWIEEGDFRKLLRAPSFAGLYAQVAMDVLVQLANLFSPRSPLRGERMSTLLLHALREMDKNRDDATLLRPGGKLQLFVTATDLTGFDVLVPSGAGGASQRDAFSAQVFEFTGESGDLTQFGPHYTPDLAFAGRATASLPGAFAPVGQASFRHETGENLALHTNVFRYDYPDPERAKGAVFVDGGVLNNAPFGAVIDAIAARSAESQVYRRLIYIQPDPGRRLDQMTEQTVSQDRRWLSDLWAVSGVRGSHPIVLDLLNLRDMNWRIAEVAAIADRQMDYVQLQIAEARKAMPPRVGATVPRGSAESQRTATAETLTEMKTMLTGAGDVQELSDKMHERARLALGPAWPTYQRLKFEATVRRLAVELAIRFGFPDKSGRASFGSAAILAWAQRTADWLDGGEALSEELRATDVPYRERRLMFIIAGINDLYPKDGAEGGAPPPRDSLDYLKKEAWRILADLRARTKSVVAALPAETVTFLSQIDHATLLKNPEEFVNEHTTGFEALLAAYRAGLAEVLGNDSVVLWEKFRQATATWTNEEAEQALLSRYLGFPLWDGMIFPTITLTELPQFTPIGVAQFSPLAASALTAVDKDGNEVPKLQGLPLHHFGAFLDRKARENDYLWGRLDGAELILRTLGEVAPEMPGDATPGRLAEALTAVLDTERGLKAIPGYLLDHLRTLIKDLSKRPGGWSGRS